MTEYCSMLRFGVTEELDGPIVFVADVDGEPYVGFAKGGDVLVTKFRESPTFINSMMAPFPSLTVGDWVPAFYTGDAVLFGFPVLCAPATFRGAEPGAYHFRVAAIYVTDRMFEMEFIITDDDPDKDSIEIVDIEFCGGECNCR